LIDELSINRRDVAIVLSGGGMSGVVMELGFLQRLRESVLWDRVGVIFGTSAGALAGCMAVLDRLDDLEDFLLRLRPEEAFRANRLWRLPLLGTHDYVLPKTIAKRLGDTTELANELAAAERELVVIVTDITPSPDESVPDPLFERAYSSRTTPPEEMAQAMMASAAISALVLPLQVGDRVGTDGGWVRNYPLGYAYERPDIELIVGFRYVPRYPVLGAGALQAVVERLRRYSRLPAARALVAELEEAVDREERGLPAHIADIFSRLSRVSIIRNTELEERVADWRDQSVRELQSLREDVGALVAEQGGTELGAAVEERFGRARFPFRHDRVVPRITVVGAADGLNLDPGFRNPKPWTEKTKRQLIASGRNATDQALREHGLL
jgi:predicted acylesterase/phospholipase RssA